MSAESGAGIRAPTPSTSGRDSPLLRVSRQHPEEGTNSKDKPYRRYANGVERALASFESPQQEWADYISFLGRLLKALQARPADLHTVPDSYTVAARLAQCLTPALPPGVHRKAIDVYIYIFEAIGKSNLEKELHLWLSGLVPVLSFASLAVRPEFLRLLETNILPLDAQYLRAPLKSIILCILPGLEDESSEDHDAWLQLMNKIRIAAQSEPRNESSDNGVTLDSYFWQCFFLATTTNPSRRQGALSYLVREMPNFSTGKSNETTMESTQYASVAARAALTPEPGLLIRCLAAGLSDPQVLVQRGFLDLLVTHLPLDSSVVQKSVPQADLDRLVFAATGVVGRRDMGLNRRLWAWFLGPEAKDEPDTPSTPNVRSPDSEASRHAAYFARYGLSALSRSMRSRFASHSLSTVERARPFKLCLSLMDRWEVGGLLIPEILIPAMQSALDFSKTADKSAANEVIKSASNFFDGVESSLIWATFNKLIEDVFSLSADYNDLRAKRIALCTFIVSQFNIREEDMIVHHIPQTCLFMLASMKRFYHATKYEHRGTLLTDSLAILEKLLTLVPTRAYAGSQKASDITKRKEVGANVQMEDIIKRIKRFYGEQHGGVDGTPVPFPAVEVGLLMIRQASTLLLELYSATPNSVSLDILTRIVCGLVLTVPRASLSMQQLNILGSFISSLNITNIEKDNPIAFRILSSITALLCTLQTSPNPLPNQNGQTESLEVLLIGHLWGYLSPHNPKHHVESVRCIWQIESINPPRKLIEAVITTLLSKDISQVSERNSSATADAARRFAVLWNHSIQERLPTAEKSQKGVLRKPSNSFPALGQFSVPTDPTNVLTRPLLLMLDCLQDEGTELSFFVRSWLQELPTLSRVFLIITEQLRSLQCLKVTATGDSITSVKYDDTQECLYFLRILLEMVRNSSEQVWLSLAGDLAESLSRIAANDSQISIQTLIVQLALRALDVFPSPHESVSLNEQDVHRTALELITVLLHGSYPQALADLKIYDPLLRRLHENVASMDSLLQAVLLRAIASALKLSFAHYSESTLGPSHARKSSKDMLSTTGSKISLAKDATKEPIEPRQQQSPPLLIECLKLGFETGSSRLAIDNWVEFLIEILPLFPDAIFQNLIPLVECLCKQISIIFKQMKTMFKNHSEAAENLPEPTLIGLLNSLEHIIANAHRRLLREDGQVQNPKTPEQPQGFFGNMVQGVFSAESEKSARSTVANSRLTVLLCFQDAVRTCFSIWSWGTGLQEKPDSSSQASYSYTALRMRNRSRRLLEHLFAAEALECMETLASLWNRPARVEFEPTSIFGLLNVLSGSKPKHTIPAIFNAIYSRTNPAALEPSKVSSLTSELRDVDLVAFLVEYTRTLDDDAMDEIWSDCVAFLRDVLANPLPHSHILPSLLLFTALLAEKVDNTNFGEQRKMRRDLGDLFLRILTATFTTRPMGFLQEPSSTENRKVLTNGNKSKRSPDVLAALASVIPQLKVILGENDRILNAVNSIITNVTGPTLRAKAFPSNIDQSFLDVLQQLTKTPQAAKLWKKDVADALNDSRFFSMHLPLIKEHWLSILRDFMHNDKDRLPELLSRLVAPATAGLVFGVGATSARNEADRRTQLNLRRIALLVLASPEDAIAKNIGSILEKLSELSSATPTSSPSSATLGDVYMLLRALFLRTSPIHLAPLWPLVNTELQSALSSILPNSSAAPDRYSNSSILQAAKLLDLLTTLDQDDFQLHAWLFITDSIDAVHRPTDGSVPPLALVDAVADGLSAEASVNPEVDGNDSAPVPQNIAINSNGQKVRRPVLDGMLDSLPMDAADLRAMQKQDLAVRVLGPFFGQLSLLCYEATYGMVEPDVQYCEDGLLRDMFEDAGSNVE